MLVGGETHFCGLSKFTKEVLLINYFAQKIHTYVKYISIEYIFAFINTGNFKKENNNKSVT